MKKLLLLFIMLLVFSWVFNTNRGMLDTASDVLRKVNDEVETKSEMGIIAKAAIDFYERTGKLPSRELQQVVRRYLEIRGKQINRHAHKDRWGTIYRIKKNHGTFDVISAGPDKEWRTADDITLSQKLPEKTKVSGNR